jgi:hypothetical protein
VELSGLLPNPQYVDLLRKIQAKLKTGVKQRPESQPKLKPPQGEVLKTIQLVLLEHPDGLHTYEVRQLVEERLGRKLPRSTVKGCLAEHPKLFERLRRGVYRIRYAA